MGRQGVVGRRKVQNECKRFFAGDRGVLVLIELYICLRVVCRRGRAMWVRGRAALGEGGGGGVPASFS